MFCDADSGPLQCALGCVCSTLVAIVPLCICGIGWLRWRQGVASPEPSVHGSAFPRVVADGSPC